MSDVEDVPVTREEFDELKRELAILRASKGDITLELGPLERADMPVNLHAAPAKSTARKSFMSGIPKIQPFPSVLKDDNGLASEGLKDKTAVSMLTGVYPGLQKDALEMVKLATVFRNRTHTENWNSNEEYYDVMDRMVRLSVDNVLRIAQAQKKLAWQAKGVKGIETLLETTTLFERDSKNIIEKEHVAAVKELGEYRKTMAYNARPKNPSFNPYNPRGRGRGRGRGGGRGNGGYTRYPRNPRGRGSPKKGQQAQSSDE